MNNNQIQQNNSFVLNRPIRAVHFVSTLGYGGVDHWLMNLLRLQRSEVVFDIITYGKGQYDDEARSLGATVHQVRKTHGYPYHIGDLRKVLSNNQYDVAHIPVREFCSYLLREAANYDIPVRIAHSHLNGRNNLWYPKNFIAMIHHLTFDLYYCQKYATKLLACNQESGYFYFRNLWKYYCNDPMVYCGIPIGCYDIDFDSIKRTKLCQQYNIPEDSIIIGHIGRLGYQKNQQLLLHIFMELSKRNKRYVLFIGGEGECRSELEKTIKNFSLENKVFLPGICNNVSDIICHLFDVFCLPSYWEGLPIALMEALAGGLHCVCSDVITTEITDCQPQCFTPVRLQAPISQWCDAIEFGIKKKTTPREGVAFIKQTPFTIENSMSRLINVYHQELVKNNHS
jgi:glycosyltransferase involved in cell wall biosynthesis